MSDGFFPAFRRTCSGRARWRELPRKAPGTDSGGGFECPEQAVPDHGPDPVGGQLGEALEPVAGLQEAGSAPDAALDRGGARAIGAGEAGIGAGEDSHDGGSGRCGQVERPRVVGDEQVCTAWPGRQAGAASSSRSGRATGGGRGAAAAHRQGGGRPPIPPRRARRRTPWRLASPPPRNAPEATAWSAIARRD